MIEKSKAQATRLHNRKNTVRFLIDTNNHKLVCTVIREPASTVQKASEQSNLLLGGVFTMKLAFPEGTRKVFFKGIIGVTKSSDENKSRAYLLSQSLIAKTKSVKNEEDLEFITIVTEKAVKLAKQYGKYNDEFEDSQVE